MFAAILRRVPRDPIASYLGELEAELRRHGGARRRARVLFEECRFHLEAEAEALAARGVAEGTAREEAVRRFGEPARLAAEWLDTELASGPSRGRWILATTAGILAGLGLGVPAGRWLDAVLGMAALLPVVGLVVGSILGASQALALRSRGRLGLRWVAASGLGLAAGLTGGTLLVKALDGAGNGVALTILGASTGLALGLAQWSVARPAFDGALRWIGAHGVGGALGLAGGGLGAAPILGGLETVAGFALAVLTGALGTGLAGSLSLERLPTAGRA